MSNQEQNELVALGDWLQTFPQLRAVMKGTKIPSTDLLKDKNIAK